MRLTIDRGADALRIAFSAAPVARRVDAAEGVAVLHDAAGRIVGVEVCGVDPAALQDVTVDLSDVADWPAEAPRPTAPPTRAASPPSPAFYDGPVSWDPEAEAAVARVPFFQRGQVRLAAIALVRQRGLDRVTAALLAEVRGGR